LAFAFNFVFYGTTIRHPHSNAIGWLKSQL